MKRSRQDEKQRGSVEVEAMFILPITVISVVMLIYLALFMYHRANLQEALETSLIYYKSVITDTYVGKTETISYSERVGSANTYSATQPLSPYRGIFGDGNNLNDVEAFKKMMKSAAGNMLFGDDIEVDIQYSNKWVADELLATAVQTVHFPLKFELLAMDGEYEIKATARVAAVNHDSVIRDVDYAIQLISDTKLGEIARGFENKVKETYNNIKEKLNAK